MYALVRCGDTIELYPAEISPEDRERGSIFWYRSRLDEWQIVKVFSAREQAVLRAMDRLIGRRELMELFQVELPKHASTTTVVE